MTDSFRSAARYASAWITAIEWRSAKVISVVRAGIGDCRSSATVRSPPQITRTLQTAENASVASFRGGYFTKAMDPILLIAGAFNLKIASYLTGLLFQKNFTKPKDPAENLPDTSDARSEEEGP